jgi:hypothetical protein
MTVVTPATPPTTADLTGRARALAAAPADWLHRVRLSADGRWYERVHRDRHHEVWLISWLPGQSTGFHDHGDSRGAFAVALGSLEEHDIAGPRRLTAGQARGFGRGYVHDVRNNSPAPAVSVHVYSPPLSVMNRYDLIGSDFVLLAQEDAGVW